MSWFSKRVGKGKDILILPGAYDPLSARIIAESGSEAVYCGGFAATASQFGLPDLALLGLTDMTEIYRRISSAIGDLPLIADGDTGHGGLLNVQRTTEQFAMAGVDAFHIEDQAAPKRCGHLGGKTVVDRHEAVARIRAAVDAAGSLNGPAIIARTDAIATHGFEEAVDRAKAFLDAGACAVFLDAPTSLHQIETIPEIIGGPVVFNAAPTGTGLAMKTHDLAVFGYACVIHPIELLLAAKTAVQRALRTLQGRPENNSLPVDFDEMNSFLKTTWFLEKERSLAVAQKQS